MGLSNLSLVLRDLGGILIILGVLILSLLVIAFIFHEDVMMPVIATGTGVVLIGLLLRLFFRTTRDPEYKHAMVCAALVWLIVPAFSAILFVLIEDMNPLDAYFESMSGWTGTGLTMVTHPSRLTHTIQFWRSLMQWVGGVGVIVLMLTILARPGTGAYVLYRAEAREERIKPSIISTVRMTWWIYLFLTSMGILIFFIAGMKPWEAMNHAMTAIGTGGFSVTDNSIASYNSFIIELAVIPMMILGAIPFLVHYRVLKGNIRAYIKDTQCITFMVMFSILLIPLLVTNYFMTGSDIFTTARYSLFQLVSGMTCTGFQTTDVSEWHLLSILIVTMGMVIGGATGSTAGGVKLLRAVIAYKWIRWSLKRNFLPPRAIIAVRLGDKLLERWEMVRIFSEASLIIILWIFFLIIGVGVLTTVVGSHYNLGEIIFEVASAQGNVGLTTGLTNPGLPGAGKMMLIFNMWVGRLEIIPVLMLLRAMLKGFEPF